MSQLRTQITEDMKQAMKDKDQSTLATLRLVNAGLKDKDIEVRVAGGDAAVTDADVLTVLQKMLKQREESAKTYADAGRNDLADKEKQEIEIINRYMPKQLGAEELDNAIDDAIAESGAEGPRDMGKVIAILKDKYAGQINMGEASGKVKNKLNG